MNLTQSRDFGKRSPSTSPVGVVARRALGLPNVESYHIRVGDGNRHGPSPEFKVGAAWQTAVTDVDPVSRLKHASAGCGAGAALYFSLGAASEGAGGEA